MPLPKLPPRPALFQPDPLPDLEQAFQRQYADAAQQHQLNPNPDAQQFYDYRSAFRAGVRAPDQTGHWPSQYKEQGHPNQFVGGFDTRTGQPVPGQPPATIEELKHLGWDDDFANTHGSDALRGALIQRERGR